MTAIPPFASINYERTNTFDEEILSKLSNYFYLGGPTVTVVKDNQIRLESKEEPWYIIAMKVASYVILLPVNLFLFPTYYCFRKQYDFTVIPPSQSGNESASKGSEESDTISRPLGGANKSIKISLKQPSSMTHDIAEKVEDLSQQVLSSSTSSDESDDISEEPAQVELSLDKFSFLDDKVKPASPTYLVLNNKLDEVKTFIQNIKAQKENSWRYEIEIADVCRDAILQGHEEIITFLLKEGMNADAKAHLNGKLGCVCPLKHFAAAVGNLFILKLLVQYGAKIEYTRDFHNDNQDAMRAAIENGHFEVVQYLLEKGGNANGVFQGFHAQTFLGRAAFDDQKNLVNLFVQYGANVKAALELNYSKFTESRSNLDDLAWQKYSNSVRLLLDYTPGINFDDGLTFLKDLDITGFNFAGVSVDGKPVDRKMLKERGLKGFEKAIITCDDIAKIENIERKEALITRLQTVVQSLGEIISKEGIYSLMSLADAAENGFLDVVKVRLFAGVSPNQKTEGFSAIPALVASAKNGYFEIVKLLAEHPEIEPTLRLDAIHKAKKNGHLMIVEYLCSLADVDEKDQDGDALIHKAVKSKDLLEIKSLVNRGADINLTNGKGYTPLLIAASDAGNIQFGRVASDEDIEILEFLLENGADPNKFCGYDGRYSPLHAAANAGSCRAVELLINVTEKKEDPKIVVNLSDWWYVPLMFDSYGSKEWLQILSLLIKHGANLNAIQTYKQTTILNDFILNFPSLSKIKRTIRDLQLTIAECKDRVDLTQLQKKEEQLIIEAKTEFGEALKTLVFLLDNDADPNIVCGSHKTTPLHVFIKEIDLSFIEGATEQVIELFLSHGMNINATDAYGYTPLHEAASSDLEAAAYLISKGADIEAKTINGCTPLHIAAAGRPKTTKLLIDSGVEVNTTNNNGETPLVFSKQACINNNNQYVKPSYEREIPYREAQQALRDAGEK